MCNRTQNDAIWGLIALFLTNQIAGNTIDFKMNVIKDVTDRLRFLNARRRSSSFCFSAPHAYCSCFQIVSTIGYVEVW